MLTVDTPAESRLLTTINAVKAMIVEPDPTGHDELLNSLINRASAAVERFCGRVFARESVTETIEGSGSIELLLERTPIISIVAVQLDGVAVSDVVISDRDAGLIFTPSGFRRDTISQPIFLQPWPSSRAQRNWEISYVGGYYLPTFTAGVPTSSDVPLPGDLEGLVIDTVVDIFTGTMSGRRTSGVVSEKIGDWSASYASGNTASVELSARVKDELERNWRRTHV